MTVKLRKIGNSLGIIIPKDILERTGLKEGYRLNVADTYRAITLTVPEDDFNRQLDAAERFMDRYKVALKKLAE